MKSDQLFKNILFAFIFFFIGRLIVFQMGELGYWIVGGVVIAFYVAWYFWGRFQKTNSKDE